jgi:hypothetical protein
VVVVVGGPRFLSSSTAVLLQPPVPRFRELPGPMMSSSSSPPPTPAAAAAAAQAAEGVRTLLIDNFDSYTFNLYQCLAEVNGRLPCVVRNDQLTWEALQAVLPYFHNVVVRYLRVVVPVLVLMVAARGRHRLNAPVC